MLFEQRSWNSFRARKTAFSSKWFICNLLSGRDQVPLAVHSFKWAPRPSFDASVNICRACFSGCNGWPGSKLLSSVTWGLVLPFLVILGPSSCSSSATVWVSYEVDLGGHAFLWLWEDLWGMWTAGPGTPDWTKLSEFCLSRPANAGSDLALFQVELVTYEVENLFWIQSLAKWCSAHYELSWTDHESSGHCGRSSALVQ